MNLGKMSRIALAIDLWGEMLIRIFPKGPQSEWGWSRTGWSWQDEFCWAMALKRVDLPPEHGDLSGELMIHQEFNGRVIPIEQIAFLIGTCGKQIAFLLDGMRYRAFRQNQHVMGVICEGWCLWRCPITPNGHFNEWGKMMIIHWHWGYPIFRRNLQYGIDMYINIDR